MAKPLKDLLDEVAAGLYDEGRHNEAEFLEALGAGLKKVDFYRSTYLQSEALSLLIETLDQPHSHQSYCSCEKCPHCGEVLDA